MNSHELVFFQMSSYFGLLAMRVFDLIVFLELNIISNFMFYVFCSVLWWLRAPKKSLPIFAKHDF